MRERRKKSFKILADLREDAVQKLASLWEEQSGRWAGAGEQPPEHSPSLLCSRGAQPSAFPAQLLTSPGFTREDLQAPLGPLHSSRTASPGRAQPPCATGTPSPGEVFVSSLHPLRLYTAWWIATTVSKNKHRNQHTCWERGLAGAGVPESSCNILEVMDRARMGG